MRSCHDMTFVIEKSLFYAKNSLTDEAAGLFIFSSYNVCYRYAAHMLQISSTLKKE